MSKLKTIMQKGMPPKRHPQEKNRIYSYFTVLNPPIEVNSSIKVSLISAI